MKKAFFLLLFLPGIAIHPFAQKPGKAKIDSLFTRLQAEKPDTAKVNTLNALADEFKNNDPDTAVYFAGEARLLSVKLKYKAGIADAFLCMAYASYSMGNYGKGLQNASQALDICKQLLPISGKEETRKLKKQIAGAYNILGLISWAQGNYEEALKDHTAALTLRKELGCKQDIARSYNNIGLVHYSKSNYTEALKSYSASLKIASEIRFKLVIALTYGNIGNVYFDQGNYPDALRNDLASLKIWEEIGDNRGIARSFNNIGLIYSKQGNFPEALKNYSFALKIREELGDKQGIASTYSNIGNTYSDQGNYAEALSKYFASLKIRKEIGDKQGIIICYSNIGLFYFGQGIYPEALKNYFSALNLSQEIGDKAGIASSCNDIGKVYTKLRKQEDAAKFLNRGLLLGREIGSLEIVKNSYRTMASLDSSQGNCPRSLEHFKMFINTRDSMFNFENTKKIEQSKMQYEFEKKESLAKVEQEKKDAVAQKELQTQKLVRDGFIGGFAVVLLFAVIFLVQRNRINKEKGKSDSEKKRSDELLLNILPVQVAEELKQTGHCQAKTFSMVSVMFADFKDFTSVSEKVSAELLVNEINFCFSTFDGIMQKHNIEKIKTIGDAYICASGLPILSYTHALDLVTAALEIQDFILARKKEKEAKGEIPFEVRIGIHTGPVVAGIVGVKKFQYDIWGDMVNLAARMESSGEAGQVNISGTTYELVRDKFICRHRGKITAKHKGEIDMYFVEGRK